jgi:hypothetical protein
MMRTLRLIFSMWEVAYICVVYLIERDVGARLYLMRLDRFEGLESREVERNAL